MQKVPVLCVCACGEWVDEHEWKQCQILAYTIFNFAPSYHYFHRLRIIFIVPFSWKKQCEAQKVPAK